MFQNPGGTGGGYSGGSNHGALHRSQSSNHQFPNLVRQRFNSRVSIKQPVPPKNNPSSGSTAPANPKSPPREAQDQEEMPIGTNQAKANDDGQGPQNQVPNEQTRQLPPITKQGTNNNASIPDTQLTVKAKPKDLYVHHLDSPQRATPGAFQNF